MMKRPKISEPVLALMNMEDEMVTAADIAPIVHMSPDVIIKYAKDGKWDQDDQGRFITSGNRVKFFRLDFLRKGGWIPPEAPKNDTLTEVLDELVAIRQLLKTLIDRKETST